MSFSARLRRSSLITNKLKRVVNAAAHVLTGTTKLYRGLTQMMHDNLNWLDVPERVKTVSHHLDSSLSHRYTAPRYLVAVIRYIIGSCCFIIGKMSKLKTHKDFNKTSTNETFFFRSSLQSKKLLGQNFTEAVASVTSTVAMALVPRKHREFYKYWWDEELSALKQAALDSFKIWSAVGKPKYGNDFETMKRNKELISWL